jgi:WD40 repeat protein
LASGGNAAKLWDVASGREVASFRGHSLDVGAVAFSPDGKRLATAATSYQSSSSGDVRVWDVSASQRVLKFQRFEDKETKSKPNAYPDFLTVESNVAFSPNGKSVAAGLADNTVKLWDVATGQESLDLKGHLDVVSQVVFSPAGKRLVTASADKTVRIWDATSGQESLSLQGHTDLVTCLAFSLDGKHLATASQDNTVKIWDMESGKEINGLRFEEKEYVLGMAFSPDGEKLATESCGTDTIGFAKVTIWNLANRKEILAVNTPKSTYRKKTVKTPRVSAGSAWAFSPDGKRLAGISRSNDNNYRNTPVHVWDTITGEKLLTLNGHTAGVIEVAYSPDGKRLATASDDKTVKIWDSSNGQSVLTLTHIDPVVCLAFSPDGKRMATASRKGGTLNRLANTVKIRDIATGQELLSLKHTVTPVDSLAFSPDGKRLVLGSRIATYSEIETLVIWDASKSMKEWEGK